MIHSKVLAKIIRKFEKHALIFKNLFLVAFISQTKVLQEIFWHTIEGETLSYEPLCSKTMFTEARYILTGRNKFVK